jgi:hypothetical protein
MKGYREQLNLLSAYIDGSAIYGLSSTIANHYYSTPLQVVIQQVHFIIVLWALSIEQVKIWDW